MEQNITVWLALVAGLISFISPCVLPLVPAYIGYMGGRVTHSIANGVQPARPALNKRFSIFLHGLAFVGGFTFIFVALGLLANAFVNVIGGYSISTITGLIGRLGGVLIIFFGLHFMGLLPTLFNKFLSENRLSNNPLISVLFALAGSALIFWGFSETPLIWESFLWEVAPWAPLIGLAAALVFWGWMLIGGAFTDPRIFWNRTLNGIQALLYMDTRPEMNIAGKNDLSSSAVMGIVFAAGWTPCIGPVYGAVLTMAASPGSNVAEAGLLLTAYSLGLGIPFLITALMLDSAQGVLRGLNRHMQTIKLVSGAFLVLIGFLVASNQLQRLSQQLSVGEFAEFSINIENSILDLFTTETDPTPAPEALDNTESSAGISALTLTNPETNQEPPLVGGIQIPQDSVAVDITTLLDSAEAVPEIAQAIPVIGLNVGNLAPDFETLSDTGVPVRLSDLRGQVILLNFWATWCPPCEKEMPEFEQAFHSHHSDGFTILAVNNAESVAQVQNFREEYSLTFPLVMDQHAAINRQYGIRNYPSTFIIDREGKIIFRAFGELTAEQIQAEIQDALDR